MKIKMSILAVLIFGSIYSSNAQQHRMVEERIKTTVTRMTDSLNLDNSQVEKSTVVIRDFYTSIDKMRSGLAPGTRPDRSEMDKMIRSRDDQLSKILSTTQMQKFKDMEERMRQERMQRQ